MPFFVKQATMDQIQAEIDRLSGMLTDVGQALIEKTAFADSDILPAAVATVNEVEELKEAAEAAEKKANAEIRRLQDGWRATSDELQLSKQALATANAQIAKATEEIKRADAATDRAESQLDAEQSDHAKTRRAAESTVQGLKANHADILKSERAQAFNLNELVAKLNRDIEGLKEGAAKTVADLVTSRDDLELDYLAKLANAESRRNVDLAAVRAQCDAEVAAVRDLADRLMAAAKKGA